MPIRALLFSLVLQLAPPQVAVVDQIRVLLDQLTQTVRVAPGSDLAALLSTAQPGTTVVLPAGATFVGNFVLRSGITLMSSAVPSSNVRVSPSTVGFATLRSTNGPVVQTAPGAHDITLVGLELTYTGGNDLVLLGDGSSAQRDAASVPTRILMDRCYVHGDATNGGKRGIALNSASTTISNSYVSDFKASGQDSQAIAGWNGPGPYRLENNYLEGAGENVIFGGGDPSIQNLVPSDITIVRNRIAKRPEWRGGPWQVKNLLELKNARLVTIADNVFDYNWPNAQDGRAILFTVRNQDGGCPWCVVEDVEFANNELRHVGMLFSILGFDNNHPSQQTKRITIHDNAAWDFDPATWGGNGAVLMAQASPRDITLDHNTLIATSGYVMVQLDGPPIPGFVLTNNLLAHRDYGIIGAAHGVGKDSIAAFLAAPQIAKNVFADGPARLYPPDNLFPSLAGLMGELTPGLDLTATSVYRHAGTDGLDLGRRR